MKEYKGLYHVLHGASPMEGTGPIMSLIIISCDPEVQEVIIATTTAEGEATAILVITSHQASWD